MHCPATTVGVSSQRPKCSESDFHNATSSMPRSNYPAKTLARAMHNGGPTPGHVLMNTCARLFLGVTMAAFIVANAGAQPAGKSNKNAEPPGATKSGAVSGRSDDSTKNNSTADKSGKAADASGSTGAAKSEEKRASESNNGKAGDRPKGPNENASDNAKAVHAIIEKFEVQRDKYLTDRKALLDSLKTASEAEKKAILDQLRTERQAREDEERAMAKQIREEMKKLRDERKAGER